MGFSEAKNVNRWIIALTGASGARYGLRLLDALEAQSVELHVVISESACLVLQEEEEVDFSYKEMSSIRLIGRESDRLHFYHPSDIGALIASGTVSFDGMVIAPCSMGTAAAIAAGLSQNLIHRVADVTIKEGRKLIIMPREAPLSSIHLENLLKLSRIGVTILPAMPGFYHRPASIADLVDLLVMKTMDQMGIESNLTDRWSGKKQND